MKTTSFRAATPRARSNRSLSAKLACALLASTCLAAPAFAQTATTAAFPVRQFTDSNGVDLLSGAFTTATSEVLIGDRENGLSFQREIRDGFYADSMLGTIRREHLTFTVSMGGASEKFVRQPFGDSYSPAEQRGSSLVYDSYAHTYTYRTADGTVATFDDVRYDFGNAKEISLSSVLYPSGKELSFHYRWATIVDGQAQITGRRLQSVTSNTGYHMKFTYENNANQLADSSEAEAWGHLIKVTGVNLFTDHCETSANDCSYTGERPKLTIPTLESELDGRYGDSLGRITRYLFDDEGRIAGIQRPGSPNFNVSIGYSGGKVSAVNVDGVVTTYSYHDSNGIRTVTVTRGSMPSRVMNFDLAKSQLIYSRDEAGLVTEYELDSSARVTKVIRPGGATTSYVYDGRGNAVTTTHSARPGTPEAAAPIVTHASFDAACTIPAKCNKPNTTTDALGRVTDYTYDPTHGGLVSVKLPAAPGGVRPETRYSYERLDAYGAPSLTGVYMPKATSSCRTQALCSGTADEVRTTTEYGQHLRPVLTIAGAGDSSLTAATATDYDVVGNPVAVDGPLPGSADTTRFRWDAGRQLVGTLGPDPDGSGPLKHRAVRTEYNLLGQPRKSERGTVAGHSNLDWEAFAGLETVETEYDDKARPVARKLIAGNSVQALSQTGYDPLGRVQCTVRRMNPAEFASPPADTCADPSPGGDPDRISRTHYDSAGRVERVESGVGVDPRDVMRMSYTATGEVGTRTDGENNKTSYEYDGFGRLKRTIFPSPVKGSGTSNPADYEESGYDAAGNVVSRRLRDGQTASFGYDDLNRLNLKDLPGSEPDVSYGHDLLGRVTGTSRSGETFSFAYDALGRQVGETGPQGTVASAYDLGGRRTRITHPDGFFVDQDYLVTGEMAKIRENGATSGAGVLATFGYDDLGRRTSLTRGNGTSTSYGYDSASRLSQLVQDLGGMHDLSLGFAYNPASEIVTSRRSNDVYAWTGNVNGTRQDAANGLNQLASIGGVATAHDARGNMTFDGTRSYSYTSENLLAASGGTTLGYDPLMRLELVSGDATVRFGYDGSALIAERDNAGALKRRWVHGPGPSTSSGQEDEPLVEYEGSGTGNRRWLHADERGSVIALSNESSGAVAVNRFDEYGVPAASNAGRFQYTGQVWLPEVGLYYYKVRMYNPPGGRFMQTDPIGYGDGMNMYAYVGGDPVNGKDPSGTELYCSGPNCDGATLVVTGYRFGSGGAGGSGPVSPPNWRSTCGTYVPNADAIDSRCSEFIGGGGGQSKLAPKRKPQKPKARPCSGVLKDIADGLYDGGGRAIEVSGGLAVVGLASLATPVTAPAAPLLEGLAVISVAVGLASRAVAGAYYWYNGGNTAQIGKAAVGTAIATANARLKPLPGKDGAILWEAGTEVSKAKEAPSRCGPN